MINLRIPKEEYREVINLLKRYSYNCLNIIQRQNDILSLSVSGGSEGRSKYSISDSTLNKVLRLEEDVALQRSIREFKLVKRVLYLVTKDAREIFDKLYIEQKTKWEIIEELHISEETYKRRKRELVYTTYKEMKEK